MKRHFTTAAAGVSFPCALLLAALAAAPAGVRAASFTVANLNDSGSGSLRDAIDQANRSAGADSITFSPGVIGTIVLSTGAIDIFDELSINGPGASRLTVTGNGTTRIFRIGPVGGSASFATTISGLTLANASTPDEGGAVFVDDSSLTVDGCVFRNNSAQRGGGLYAFPTGSTTLTLRNTRFETNTASAEGGGFGAQDIDTVMLDNVTASSNTAARSGGGGFLRGVNLSVQNSQFLNNTSSTLAPGVAGISGGGGLRLDGSKATAVISIVNSRFRGNDSDRGQGGAFWISALPPETPPVVASATLDRLQIETNQSELGGGGVLASHVNATVSNTTLAGNTTAQNGGGLAFLTAGALSVVNATVSGNTSTLATGGGLHSGSGTTLATTAITVVGNTAANGGGIYREGSGATLRNSILANNNAATAPDANGSFAASFTLVKNISGATLGSGSGNLAAGTDPMLAALAVNGGPTATLLPSASSPLLNAGDTVPTGLPATDQRGLPRIAGGRADIGAVERQTPEDVIFRNTLE